MSARFAKPRDPMEELRQAVADLKSALVAQTEAFAAFAARPVPTVSAPAVTVTSPEVHVPLEPLQAQMQEVVDRFGSLAEILSNPMEPQAPSVEVINEVDLTALLDEGSQTRDAIVALREVIKNINSGPRSHFDGRLRSTDGLISTSNPLPVSSVGAQTDGLTDTELRAADVEVNDDAAQALLTDIIGSLGDTVTAGTVRELLLRIYGAVDGLEVSLGDIDVNTDELEGKLDTLNANDFATQATLEAARVLLASIDTELGTQQTDALTDAQLRAFDVAVTLDGETVTVTGTQTDALTDAELRASAVSVTDTNPPQTDALTDAQLRLTDVAVTLDGESVAVTGTQTDALTDAELRATPVKVDDDATQALLTSIDTELGSQQTDALTDVQLRATDVGVDDGHPDPQLDALTNTELRAADVAVTLDGESVAVTGTQLDGLTDAELRATPVPVTTTSPALDVVTFTDAVDGSIPSGSAVTIDPVLNTEPNVLDSGWISTADFAGKNIVNALADTPVDIYLMNASNSSGDNLFGDGAPVITTNIFGPAQLAALYADAFYRMVVVNTSGSSLTDYSIRSEAAPESTDGITTAIDQPVFGFYPANITRSVVMGRQPDGDYVNTPATGLAADVNGVSIQTETPLAGSAVYQCGWVDTDGWDEIEVTIAADVTSASGGIVLEFTSDANATTPVANAGTTARTFGAADVAAGSLTFRVPPRADGCRLTYTNGGSAQSSFLMEMVLRADTTSAPRGPLEADITGTQDSVVGRNALMAPDETSGAWTNIEQADGGLKVSLSTGGGVSIIALDTWTSRRVSVPAASSVELTASSPLTDRKTITIKANASNNKEVFIGPNSGVGSSSARIGAGESVTLDLDASASVWAIADAGTLSVSVIEIA